VGCIAASTVSFFPTTPNKELNMLQTRTLAKPDIPEVVEAWNRSLVYDTVTQEQFGWVMLDDPNYEPEGNIIALDRGQIVGFVSVVARGGGPHEKDCGFVKGLFVLDLYWDRGLGERLLAQAEAYLVSRGKRAIRVTAYIGGRYFFNGIDLRYERLLALLTGCGYERLRDWGEIYTIDDVAVDLTDFELAAYHIEARKRVAAMGVKITPYDPAMLEEMRIFVDKLLGYGHWFPAGWEDGFGTSGHTLVALKEGAIIGWADYRPDPQDGDFGPIGVLEAYRGNGIGTCLLVESMLSMKELGTPKATAGWAETGFYLKNGWYICRQWAPFQKEL
jgi:GNAT superfamily N-acetyltransferase